MNKAVLVLALFASFGTVYGENDTDLVYELTNCAIRAATVGIKDLIPPHNPLHIRDIKFNQTVLSNDYNFEMTNMTLANIMDVHMKQFNVTTYTNPGAVNISYKICWEIMNFTGDFAWSANNFGVETGGNGTVNIILHHTHFTGLFNLTKPSKQNGIKGHVNDFTLKINVKDVEAHIEGAGPEFFIDNIVEYALYQALNNVPSSVADFLKEKRFNGFWLANPDKIDQVIQWCHDNPAV